MLSFGADAPTREFVRNRSRGRICCSSERNGYGSIDFPMLDRTMATDRPFFCHSEQMEEEGEKSRKGHPRIGTPSRME